MTVCGKVPDILFILLIIIRPTDDNKTLQEIITYINWVLPCFIVIVIHTLTLYR